MKLKNAILLNGSPKINRSTSEALSDFMANRFVEEALEIHQARISSHLKSEEEIEGLVQHIKVSDLICLISPLYVDSLPYNVIECMEVIQTHMGHKDQNAETVFMAICQSGMEQEKNLYYASKEGQLLRALDEALMRMDRKQYGNCSECSALISLKRLEALPYAVLCIKCQSENEKNQKGR